MTKIERLHEASAKLRDASMLDEFAKSVIGSGRITIEWKPRLQLSSRQRGLRVGEEIVQELCDAIGASFASIVDRLSKEAEALLADSTPPGGTPKDVP